MAGKPRPHPAVRGYMAPIWFPLILYSIIDIHVFLMVIPFGCIYMNSSNLSGLILYIEIFLVFILISPWAPGTCTAVLGCFCHIQIIAECLWSYSSYPPIPPMTHQSTSSSIFWTSFKISELSFWRTHLPSVIFAHHSGTLTCHLFFLFSICPESAPPTTPCIAHQGANPVRHLLWQPWYHPPN